MTSHFGSGSIHDIPEPESDEPREVFAFFGLASYAAQVLEAELVNLIVATHLIERIPDTADDVEQLFSQHFALTLGRLLRVTSSRLNLPPDCEVLIRQALDARNRLVHRFYGEHSENLLSAVGRLEMMCELREMTVLFRRADAASMQISSQLFASVGVTPETTALELSSMVDTARRRDAHRPTGLTE
jgi:hypothetical protein